MCKCWTDIWLETLQNTKPVVLRLYLCDAWRGVAAVFEGGRDVHRTGEDIRISF